jgi:hypothetical protein
LRRVCFDTIEAIHLSQECYIARYFAGKLIQVSFRIEVSKLPMLLVDKFVSFIKRPFLKLSQSELFNSFLQAVRELISPAIYSKSEISHKQVLPDDKPMQKNVAYDRNDRNNVISF